MVAVGQWGEGSGGSSLGSALGNAASAVGGFFKEQVGERFANLFGSAGSFSTNKEVAGRAVANAAGNMGTLVAQLTANLGSSKQALAQIRDLQARGLLTEFDDERNAAYQQLAEQDAISNIESEQVIYGASAMARASGKASQQGKPLNREESLKMTLKKMYTLSSYPETQEAIKNSPNLNDAEKKMLLKQLEVEKAEWGKLGTVKQLARIAEYQQEFTQQLTGRLGVKRVDGGVEIDIQKFKQRVLTGGDNKYCMYVGDVIQAAAIAGSQVDLMAEFKADAGKNVNTETHGVKDHEGIATRIAGITLSPGEKFVLNTMTLPKGVLTSEQQQIVIASLERGIPLMLTDDSSQSHKQIIYGYTKDTYGSVMLKIHDPGYTNAPTGYQFMPLNGEYANRLVYYNNKGKIADDNTRGVQVIRYFSKQTRPIF